MKLIIFLFQFFQKSGRIQTVYATPLKTLKLKILKNERICWKYHFTHAYQNSQSYDVQFLRYRVRRTEFFVIPLFALLALYGPKKSKFLKNEKNTWRYCLFTNVYHKLVIWCMVPEIRNETNRDILSARGIIFCHFGPFLRLTPLTHPKNQNFEKMKKNT